MGRQLWIGVGILLVLLGIGLLLTVFVENACSPIAALLEQAGNLTEEGDWEAAAMLVHSAQRQWKHLCLIPLKNRWCIMDLLLHRVAAPPDRAAVIKAFCPAV